MKSVNMAARVPSALVAQSASATRQSFIAPTSIPRIWHHAMSVQGTGNSYSYLSTLSCATTGNCVAVGDFGDANHFGVPMVASEVNGQWGNALEIPGSGGLNNLGGNATAVSCSSPGNCTVGGQFLDAANHDQPFVASEINGVWGNANLIPGIAALNTSNVGVVSNVTCSPNSPAAGIA